MHGSCSARKQTDVDLTLHTIHLYVESSGEVYARNCKWHNIMHPHFWQWWGIRDRVGPSSMPFAGGTGT